MLESVYVLEIKQGLKACVNLKWLSVAQNKLEDLKGIEALSKLTVSTQLAALDIT